MSPKSSINAAAPSTALRLAVLAAAVLGVGVPIAQQMGLFGQTAEQFARDGETTLRAADYAFSIWGVIYLGLIAYAIYQLIAKRSDPTLRRRFALGSIIAMTGCGLWLIAAGADWVWATVVIIIISALALIAPLIKSPLSTSRADAAFITIPLSLLAGWLTIASILNTLTVLTGEGFITDASANLAAIAGVILAVAIVAFVFARSRSVAYLVPPIWGLIAVYVAEQSDRPVAAWLAIGSAACLLAVAVWALTRGKTSA